MSAGVVFLLLVPFTAMVGGFLLALRLVGRGGGLPIDGYTPAGRRVLKFEPGTRLVETAGRKAIPGPGSLLLTDGELIFERYFPRREFRFGLAEVGSVTSGDGSVGRLAIEGRGTSGIVLRVRDSDAWADAIRRAAASLPRDS